MATTGTNNDIYTKLAQLRRQVDNYVPGKTQIDLLQELESDKFFYSEQEINQQQQAVPKQQKLNTLVANNILGSASVSSPPTSKYHCYHISVKVLTYIVLVNTLTLLYLLQLSNTFGLKWWYMVISLSSNRLPNFLMQGGEVISSLKWIIPFIYVSLNSFKSSVLMYF